MHPPHDVFALQIGWETLELDGPDARDFLHRLTSADFRPRVQKTFMVGSVLQPNGKLVFYFKSLRLAENRYLLLIAPTTQSASKAAYEHFEKMHFMEDFKLTASAEKWCYLRALSIRPLPELEALVFSENRWIAAGHAHDTGLLVDRTQLSSVVTALENANFKNVDSLEAVRILSKDPAAPAEINTNVIPLEAALEDALHENKGCYPGQEVIEKIRSLGQPPRKLFAFKGAGAVPQVPSPLTASGTDAGVLTSAAKHPESHGWVGLGLIKRTAYNHGGHFELGATTVEGEPV